jgi:hypothetical protein
VGFHNYLLFYVVFECLVVSAREKTDNVCGKGDSTVGFVKELKKNISYMCRVFVLMHGGGGLYKILVLDKGETVKEEEGGWCDKCRGIYSTRGPFNFYFLFFLKKKRRKRESS